MAKIFRSISFQFFAPLKPVRIEFELYANGRPTGEANVDFATHPDALEAMKKHKTNMRMYLIFFHILGLCVVTQNSVYK